jgi:putative photosynthetic complex assembly protein
MNDHGHSAEFPKFPLYSALALIATTLVLVVAVRVTGVGDLRTPQAAVVTERLLRFADQRDGGIVVRDAVDDQVIEAIAPGTNGFLRGTLRGLARERKREGIGPEASFRLTARSDGRLLLQDPATGRLVDLGSFGPTNAAVFARLLTERTRRTGESTAPTQESGRQPANYPLRQLAATHQ